MNKFVNSCFHEKFSGGIGDFLRGSVYLCNFCLLNNKNFYFNFKYHKIGQYIHTKFNKEFLEKDIIDLETLTNDESSNWVNSLKIKLFSLLEKDQLHISSFFSESLYKKNLIHFYNKNKIKKEIKTYFANNICFSDSVKEYVNKNIEALEAKKFNVIHFRLGDVFSWKDKFEKIELPINSNFYKANVFFKNCLRIINKIKNISKEKIVIISDSNDLKSYLEELNLSNVYIFHKNSIHCSKKPSLLIKSNHEISREDSDLFYVAADMYLLTLSNLNFSFSVYNWGSGLPYWTSRIFDVPIYVHYLGD